MFEQRRSDALGGAVVLQQQKEKYLFVVGKVGCLSLLRSVKPGAVVRNVVSMTKSSESVLDFKQELVEVEGEGESVVASGTVTVVCCDAKTQKMCAIPESIGFA